MSEFRLVDLSGTDHNGGRVQMVVNPNHISSMSDESGSYYRYTRINLLGGQSVRVPYALYEVQRLLGRFGPTDTGGG